VAIARCVSHAPAVVLLDDPLAALDPAPRAAARDTVVALLRRVGLTGVHATYSEAEARAIGDRIAVLRAGRIEQVGRYAELYARPATAFVAGFIGQPAMNLLAGVAAPGGVRLAAPGPPPAGDPGDPGWVLSLPAAQVAHLAPGTPLTVGLRPEAFRLAGADEAGIPARLGHAGPPAGDGRRLVTCVLGPPAAPGPEVVAALPEPGAPSEPAGQVPPLPAAGQAPAPGPLLRLSFAPDQLHLFDATGRRQEPGRPPSPGA
jgi:ABC-type sugar transport system ATPase subunit